MKKRIWLIIAAAAFICITAFVFYENSFAMNEKEVVMETADGTLSGIVTTPKKESIKGIVLFVHGDGPQNATYDGGYRPLMERFAKQGYASISWDKPGVGQSEGNWLHQSMDDRAKEVENVIKWAKKEPNLQSKQIILWGASQAGWVIPKVMTDRTDITASILVGPAVNWMRQGRYNTLQTLKEADASQEQIQKTIEKEDEQNKLLEEGAAFRTYQKKTDDQEMTKDRFEFIQKNMKADATSDIKRIQSPIYLVLAQNDRNVDSAETKTIYEKEVAPQWLHIQTIRDVEHSMLNPLIHHSNTLITLAAIAAPKDFLLSQAYLDHCEHILEQLKTPSH
ncbi:alpha/beta fold hydrolase [Bacillus sp. JR_15]|uniref:alpha/beta hydrolase family protein n=1 Tax=Bacillus TaxID=1386 RepID=UPI00254C4C6E|nr:MULTISPECIES: alpha/beta fold hydrolase [Bacillus]MDR7250376.1 alpha-beta hydrolase superfamily lysophospholipase [Bacillus pumilus]